MAVEHDWGQDPSVQTMRRVFSRMEIAQRNFLGNLNISFFDKRVRGWRQAALNFFERSWAKANHDNIILDEEKIAAMYMHCFARAIGDEGVKISSNSLPHDETVETLVRETLQ
ncbi:MAG: hypothetical protein JRF06_08620 [Deltaproteobacteria bacterium]|nr:hypothetical protein [Deltaproteobacteria bacterium]